VRFIDAFVDGLDLKKLEFKYSDLKPTTPRNETSMKQKEDTDKREANISKVTAEELNTKMGMLKERKEEYENLLRNLDASGESQISLTDPDSRAMVNNQRIEVCYNV